MTNLNWYWVYVPYLDEPNHQAESALKAGYNKVVFKGEADAVIAEKDKKIDLYLRGWKESNRINASIYAELRHQKYKRCLTMAALWSERIEASTDAENKLVALRRYNKWMELAKKFKEDYR